MFHLRCNIPVDNIATLFSYFQKVLNRVIDLMTEFTCTEEQFDTMKAQLKKVLYNDMIKADDAA